jgi:aminoglycoside phosphotransferase family enzyme/gluconate kinase
MVKTVRLEQEGGRMSVDTADAHEALVQCLLDPACWPAGGGERRRVDTHISTVLLAGDRAFKIKKPLDLGFLDFRTLDARRHACDEEMRLNSRFAPEIYLGVAAITGTPTVPAIDEPGEPIDWAVVMRRFDPDAILSHQAGRLSPDLVDALARRVAAVHAEAPVCAPDAPYGTPEAAYGPMADNFGQLQAAAPDHAETLDRLAGWTLQQRDRLAASIERRRAEGRVRECHGDLHLGNVALVDGEPVVFDALEFDPALRWIDCINDIAFMLMDLQARGRPELAYRFLDRYLQDSGDYAGLEVLQYYLVYRALVRAKIASIRLAQPLDEPGRAAAAAEMRDYILLARRLAAPARGAIVMTHGVSGSGKSYAAAGLTGPLPAVRIRSDVERKRLLGLAAGQDATALGGYAEALTDTTYRRLAELAATVAAAGYVAVADATYLRHSQRELLRGAAERVDVPLLVLDCEAAPEILRQRIRQRRRESDNVSDADLEVLERQLASREVLTADEAALSIRVTPGRPLDIDSVRRRLER